jgi:hypothetical protein
MIIKIFLFFYKIHYILILHQGAVVVMLLRTLDLQLHLHSVHITTNIHGEVYSLQLLVINFVSDLRHAGGFLWVLRFLHQYN